MKIKRIEINNFRGYQGSHEIDFSVDNKKFVTLIIAENGTGKSNLMESISWSLYGTLPAQADDPEGIKNDFADPKDEISIRLTLLDDKTETPTGMPKEIIVSRSQPANKKKSILNVYEKDLVTGNLKLIKKGKSQIERLLPHRLTPYFLYSGEGILEMFKDDEEQDLRDSIEDMQGLTYAREAELYLGTYSSTMLTKIKRKGGQKTKLEDAQKKLKDANNRLTEIDKDYKRYQKDTKEFDKALKRVRERITSSNNELIAEKKKQNLDLEIVNKRDGLALKKLKEQKIRLISDKGFQALTFNLKGDIEKYFKEQRALGIVPARFSEITLNGVLESGDCICGRRVEEHSDNEEYVEAWKYINNSFDEAGTEDQSAAQTMIEELLKTLSYDNKQLRKSYLRINDEIITTEDTIRNTLKTIDDNNNIIESTPLDEDIEALLDEEKTLENSLNKANQDTMETYLELGNLQSEIKLQEKTIRENSGSEGFEEIQDQKDFVDGCIEKLNQRIEELVIEGRDELGAKLKKFNEEYNTKRDEYIDFKNENSFIPVIKNKVTGRAYGQNTANLNLLSLFYALSLIDICISRFGNKEEFVQPGTIAPLVCDAPFSSLGETNLDSAIELLTNVPEQTILLVNPKDFKEAKKVLKSSGVVGSSYFSQRLQSEEPSKNTILKIDGTQYKSFVSSKITTNSLIDLRGNF